MCKHYWIVIGPDNGFNKQRCKHCGEHKTIPVKVFGMSPVGDGDYMDISTIIEKGRRGQEAKNKALGIGGYHEEDLGIIT